MIVRFRVWPIVLAVAFLLTSVGVSTSYAAPLDQTYYSQSFSGGGTIPQGLPMQFSTLGSSGNTDMGVYFKVAQLPVSDTILMDVLVPGIGYRRIHLTPDGLVHVDVYTDFYGAYSVVLNTGNPISPNVFYWVFGGTYNHGSNNTAGVIGDLQSSSGTDFGLQTSANSSLPNLVQVVTSAVGIGVNVSGGAQVNFPNTAGNELSRPIFDVVKNNDIVAPPTTDWTTGAGIAFYNCRQSLGASIGLLDGSGSNYNVMAGPQGLTINEDGPFPSAFNPTSPTPPPAPAIGSQSFSGGGTVPQGMPIQFSTLGSAGNTGMGVYFKVAQLPVSDTILMDVQVPGVGYRRLHLTPDGLVHADVSDGGYGTYSVVLNAGNPISVNRFYWAFAASHNHGSNNTVGVIGTLIDIAGTNYGTQISGVSNVGNTVQVITSTVGVGVSVSGGGQVNFPNSAGNELSRPIFTMVTADNIIAPPTADWTTGAGVAFYNDRQPLGAATGLLDDSGNGYHQVAGPQGLTINQDGPLVEPFAPQGGPPPGTAGNALSGTIPWHPHHSTRLDDHLSASVDLADGHLDLSAGDMNIPGRGPNLALSQVWDSAMAYAGITTTAGQGWLSDLTPSIGGVLTGTVVYTTSTGETWPFTYTGALTATAPYTAYQTPPSLPWQLVTSSAGYTLTNVLSSEVMTFTAQGAYAGDQDAYGNTNVLNYTNGLPSSETNSGGRMLAFTYTNGLLSEAASPLWQSSGGTQGQHVTYGYNGTQLTTQMLGAGTTDALTTTFGYNGTQLISVTTPYTQATHTWTINYDAYGRVSSIVSPISGTLGQAGYSPAITTTFSYSSGQTQVIEGAGSSAPLTTTYALDGQGEPITITDGLGDATDYTYDADHDVLTSRDANGNTTTSYYQYVGPTGPSGLGSTGLVTETVRPSIAAYAPGGALYPVTTTNVYSSTTYDLLQSSDSEGRFTVYTYDGHHGVLTTTDRLCSNADSQTTCGAYTPPSAPLRERPFRPFGQSVTYLRRGTITSYDPYGERITTIDGRGVYVPSDGVALPGDPQTVISSTHSYTYTPQGDLAAEWTPPIVTTLGGVTNTAPVTTSYSYDADGNQISLTSANNFGSSTATTYGYDHLGRPITTTLPPVPLYSGVTATPVMTTGYDGEGNVVQQVDGNGDVTTSSYDPLGRLVAATNPVNGTTLYTYTATEKTSEQDPQLNVTTYAYDPAGRLVLSSDPLTDTVQTQYDAVGNPLTITTGTPTTTTQVETRQYDPLNEVMTDTVSGPGSPAQTTHSYYDTAGRVFQVQQPNGDVTLNSYYFTGELYQQQVYPGAVSAMSGPTYVWMNYDAAGNLIERIDADGRDTLLSVDGADRVVQQVAGPVGSMPTLTTTTGYDPDGNTISQIVTTTSPVAATRSYTAAVNAADWTTGSSDKPMVSSPALVTQYSYDAAGQQRGQTILNSSPPVTTTLDAEGRTTAIGEGLNTSSPYTTTYGYNPNDLPVTATVPNGVQEGMGYDQDSRLITTTAIGPTGVLTPLNNSYSYAYNPDGWTTAITTVVSGITSTNVITHDALGRMVAGNANGRAQSWSYDGNGNLLTIVNPSTTTTYSYTAAITPNEVLTTTSTAGVTTTYSYDQNGDTTGISSTSGVSTTLSYDSQARLDAVKLADGTTVVMTYNAQGQRVGYNVSKNGLTSESEQVTYRGDELAQAVISNTQRYTDTYLYDPTGAPLELLRQTKSGSRLTTARYWYVLNGHGDVVALTDITGTVVDSYAYDLWGRLGSASEAVPQRLRYAGYWYDQELGWYWVSVRAYNPTLMRWLQPDPSQQDGVRTYAYVGDDPVDATDPSGLDQNPPPCTAYTSHTYCPPAPNPPPTGTPTPTAGANTTRKATVRTRHIAVAAIHPSIPPEVFWRWYSRITQAYIDKEGLQQADPHVNLRVQPLGGSKTDWDNWHIRLKSITSEGGEQATYTWEAEDSVTGRTVTAEGFGSDISEAAEQAKFALAERISEASQLPEADVPDFLNSLRGFAQAVESDVEAVSGDLGTALESLPPPP